MLSCCTTIPSSSFEAVMEYMMSDKSITSQLKGIVVYEVLLLCKLLISNRYPVSGIFIVSFPSVARKVAECFPEETGLYLMNTGSMP